MIAVDTNLLVYAHREDSPFHYAAASAIQGLAEGRAAWAIPWASLHEFISVVTHPRVYAPPSRLAEAIEQIEIWKESPSLILLGENEAYWDVLKAASRTARVSGPMIHDARIAAICMSHGVRELWSADRDFSRFSGVTVRNPLF